MKKRKRVLMLLCCVMCMCTNLFGCGKSNNQISNSGYEDQKVDNSKEENSSEEEIQIGKPIKDKKIPAGVYKVGDYIKEGTYVFQNQTETSYLKVVLFESEDSYNNYNKSERFTVGEESEAIEKNAWHDVYLNNGETVYMNLNAGSVLVVYDAEIMMSSVDITSFVNTDQPSSFDKALLVVGKDIQEGQYVIECTETKSYSTKILLFDSKDTYLAYHVSSRFTNGEEQYAIDANSKASSWIQSGKSFSTYLSEGNILVIDGGNVKITTME